MIKSSPPPSVSFSSEPALSPALQRPGAARATLRSGMAAHDREKLQPAADSGFEQAMKKAVAQRAGKPAAAAEHAPAATAEAGGGADTAPARKAAGKKAAAEGDAASGLAADSGWAATHQPVLPAPETTSGPRPVNVPNPAAAAGPDAAAGQPVGNGLGNAADSTGPAAGNFGSSAGGAAAVRLEPTFSGARWSAAAHDGAIASGQGALQRALAGGADLGHTATPANTKFVDTDPGGATPLPRPQPPANAVTTRDSLQAAWTHGRAIPAATASAAEGNTVAAAPAIHRDPAGAARGSSGAPTGEPARLQSSPGSRGVESALEAAPPTVATAGGRPAADQGQAAGGAPHEQGRRGADGPPMAHLRAVDPGTGRPQSSPGSRGVESALDAAPPTVAMAGGRPAADQGQAAGGAPHEQGRRGADGPPTAQLRAADPGTDRATAPTASRAAAPQARSSKDSELRAVAASPSTPTATSTTPSGPNPAPAPAATVPTAPSDAPGAFGAATQATPAPGVAGLAAPAPAPTAFTAGALPTAIESPVTSAAFAAEAGYRISVLVREGVESAQLQLNPVELGPVTVQIVVEGLTAQVHLLAAHAETRQALEASMPQLASNLRESGLTLTGGGVSEQAPRQPGNPSDGGTGSDRGGRQGAGFGTGNGGSGSASADAQRLAPTGRGGSSGARRGVVDLVA